MKKNLFGMITIAAVIMLSLSQVHAQSTPPAGFEDEVKTVYTENPFPDTTINTLEGIAAAELYRRAVIGGFPDGEFKASRSVNRAEAAKFLLLARGLITSSSSEANPFKDVLADQWYTPYVLQAASLGIINGHPDGTFRPSEDVQKDQFLKMLTKTFGIPENIDIYGFSDVTWDKWYAPYAGAARVYELFPQHSKTILDPGHKMTRGEIAIAIYQYLKNRNNPTGPLTGTGGNDGPSTDPNAWSSHNWTNLGYRIELPSTYTLSQNIHEVSPTKVAVVVQDGAKLQYFFDTEPMPIYDIAGLVLPNTASLQYFQLPQGYCDGPGCSEPLVAYIIHDNTGSINYIIEFHWNTPADIRDKVVASFTLTNYPVSSAEKKCSQLGGSPYKAMSEYYGKEMTFCRFNDGGECTENELTDGVCYKETQLNTPATATTPSYCIDPPTTPDIGGFLFPSAPKYSHIAHLGPFFTAYDCGEGRWGDIIDKSYLPNSTYDAGSVIHLDSFHSEEYIQLLLKRLGYALTNGQTNEWTLNDPVDLEDLMELRNYSEMIEDNSCINCG